MQPRLLGANCKDCPLSRKPFNGPVPMQGDPDADLIFIGEAPGEHEAIKHEPFVGPSGRLLRGLVGRYNTGGKKVAYTNVVACRPPDNREPTVQEIRCCSGRLKLELQQHPKAKKVLLGVNATQTLLQSSKYNMTQYNGTWIDKNTFVTYHPAFILRNPIRAKVFKVALQTAFGKPKPLHQPNVSFELVSAPPPVFSGLVCIDIETTVKYKSFKKDKITCVSVTVDDKTYIVEDAYNPFFAVWLENVTRNSNVTVVGHNFKYDAKFLISQLGVQYPQRLFDTMLVHYSLNEEGLGSISASGSDAKDTRSRGHGLKLLVKKFFGIDYGYEGDWNEPDKNTLYQYAAIDTWVTMKLAKSLLVTFEKEPRAERLYWELLEPASRALCTMEMNGFRVDTQYSYLIKKELKQQKAELIAEMQKILASWGWHNPEGFDPAKRTKYEVMYGLLNLPKQLNQKTGKLTLDKTALKHLSEIAEDESVKQFIMLMIAWSNNQKMDGTYIGDERIIADVKPKKKLKEPKGLLSDVVDGLFHPNFNIQATITGRLSADRIHQIPRKSAIHPITKKEINIGKKIKNQFLPLCPEDVIVQADWSQMELRVLAWASQDQGMIDAYNNDMDLHTETAKAIFGEEFDKATSSGKKELRTKAKNFNFGVAYGMTAETVAKDWWEQLTPEQRLAVGYDKVYADAQAFYKRWFAVRPQVGTWQKEFVKKAFETGVVETIFHRKRQITFVPQDERSRGELKNHLMNFPIQGMASDCTLHSLIRIDKVIKEMQWPVRTMATVHDSIVFSVPRKMLTQFIQVCEKIMLETAIEFFGTTVKFQADFEYGKRWGSLNEIAGIVKIKDKDYAYYKRRIKYKDEDVKKIRRLAAMGQCKRMVLR